MKKSIGIIAALALCLAMVSCGNKTQVGGSHTRPAVQSSELQFAAVQEGDAVAVIHTTQGDIWVKLYPQYAPMAVENFTLLAQQGYYDNNLVTRVEKDFLVQTGDQTNSGRTGKTAWGTTPFAVESSDKLHHYAGALCMSQNKPGEGNLSQFYIVTCQSSSITEELAQQMRDAGYRDAVIDAYKAVGGAPYLDYEYTVFGQVFDGMDIVDEINAAAVDENMRPLEGITVTGVEVGVYPLAVQSASDASQA